MNSSIRDGGEDEVQTALSGWGQLSKEATLYLVFKMVATLNMYIFLLWNAKYFLKENPDSSRQKHRAHTKNSRMALWWRIVGFAFQIEG